MRILKLTAQIPEHLAGSRLDQALAQLFPEYSRARIQTWIKASNVTVDGEVLRSRDKVQTMQTVTIHATVADQETWQPQSIPLNIVYEDSSLLIINKPPGLVVHPGAGNSANTLVNALLHYAPELAEVPRAGIVHRLDKDTSGLLVVARNLEVHKNLVTQIQERQAKREYRALVMGTIIAGGTIDEPIGRHPVSRTRMAVTESGKPAVTHYRVLERFRAHTYLKVQLETGRTHQIRVHMAHIHHPIVGDPSYATRLKLPAGCTQELKQALQNFKRQALHAFSLEIQHPVTQKNLKWEAPVPDDMQELLKLLREDK